MYEDNPKYQQIDEQLSVTRCQVCNDDMNPMESYLMWNSPKMTKVYVCAVCRSTRGLGLESYPVKGLHYGDNS